MRIGAHDIAPVLSEIQKRGGASVDAIVIVGSAARGTARDHIFVVLKIAEQLA